MGHGKAVVMLITVMLMGAIGLGYLAEEPEEISEETLTVSGLSLLVSSGQRQEEIRLWDDGCGTYYGFVPGAVPVEAISFRVQPSYRVELNGTAITDGMSCGTLSLEEPYPLEIWGKELEQGQLVLTSSGQIPTVFVDVTSGNMDYIHMDKGNAERGSLRIYGTDGGLHYTGNLEAIKGRGNATWEWEKKPYNLTLMQEADLLGMGQAKHWVLLSNVYDDSHVRNRIVYDTAAQLGLSYSPESQWVALYLNGEYAGMYLLCEKNEIHPQRVAIGETDGSLISIEKADRLWEYGSDQFLTDGGTPIRIRGTANPEALKEKLNTLERAILAQDGVDPETGSHWTQLLDLESWAKKYLVEEAFGNLDAGSISQFFYWEESKDGGKIYAGPVWDYDVTMGNPHNWQLRDGNMVYAQRPHLWSPEDNPWYSALYQKEAFRERVAQLYVQQLRPLLVELLEGGMDAYGQSASSGAIPNQIRWGTESQQEALKQIQSYMESRRDFLDSLWIDQQDYCLVSVYMHWHVMACYAVLPGECIPYREVPAGWDTIEYVGWYDWATGELFDFATPITQDTLIYLKEVDTAANSDSGSILTGRIAYVPVSALLLAMALLLAAEGLRTRANGKRRLRTPEKEGRRSL